MFIQFLRDKLQAEHDDGRDLTGADRGNDLDPNLLDEEEDDEDDGDGKQPVQKSAADADKGGKSGKSDESDDEKSDDEDDDKPAGKKSKDVDDEDKRKDKRMIPKDRYDRATNRLQRENEELRKQLAQKTRQDQRVSESEQVTDLETKLEKAEADYAKAMADNDHETATKLMREMRQLDRQIVNITTTQEAEKRVTTRLAAEALDRRIAEIEKEYPEVNPDSEDYDEAATKKILRIQRGLVKEGENPVEAMNEAVALVLGTPESRQKKQEDEPDPAAGLRQERRKEATKKGNEAREKQPEKPNLGVDSDKRGAGRPGGAKGLSYADLDKLSAEQLAQMRGDLAV